MSKNGITTRQNNDIVTQFELILYILCQSFNERVL